MVVVVVVVVVLVVGEGVTCFGIPISTYAKTPTTIITNTTTPITKPLFKAIKMNEILPFINIFQLSY